MPVAVSPIDRQVRAVLSQFHFKSCNELPILVVDRALTAEVVVVFGHFKHALARHVLTAQDILQEWHDFIEAFGTPEGGNQNRVVVHWVTVSPRVLIASRRFVFAGRRELPKLLHYACWG